MKSHPAYIHHVVIRYAPKPWDRGQTWHREETVPNGYNEKQADQWLQKTHKLKANERIISFHYVDGTSQEN